MLLHGPNLESKIVLIHVVFHFLRHLKKRSLMESAYKNYMIFKSSFSLLLVAGIFIQPAVAMDLFVSSSGKDDAAGKRDSPLSLRGAISKVSEVLKKSGLPKSGVTVTLAGGRYEFQEKFVLGSEFKGTQKSPIIFRAADGESVIFDGSMSIDPETFLPVTDPAERARLAESAVDHIKVAQLSDSRFISPLKSRLILSLSVNGELRLPSVYPNSGYAKLQSETIEPEASPPAVPVGKQAYQVRAGHPPYQEKGRPYGWKGSLKHPRGARVGFDQDNEPMAGTWKQWQAELKRNNTRNVLTGFTDANWLLSSQPIHSASDETQSIRLTKVLSYGWAWRGNDKPFRVFGMLCELDQPGEWHFDPLTNKLYVYPVIVDGEIAPVRLPVASDFIQLRDTSHVSLIGLSVKNIGGGVAYEIRGGQYNLVASARISDSLATGVSVSGENNSVKGCDLIDLDRHVSLSGGKVTTSQFKPGNNEISNCHIYQKSVKHQKVNVTVRGVGNRFIGNLIHNSLGQAVVINGNDHLLARNEMFNVGYDEGDGGAMYSGGDLTGYGITYKHNFFHHLMHVPGKVARSGIHLDDRQAGSLCIGNVFYKSAEKGIHLNGGAGHFLKDNIFLEGAMGIFNTSGGSETLHKLQNEILADPNHDHVRTKENYVGRAERKVGKEGWNKEPWISRHPLFAQVMNDAGRYGRMWPIRCTAKNNYYYNNTRYNKTTWNRMPEEARRKLNLEKDKPISPADFVNYDILDLRFKGEGFPDIPFESIGLTLDEFRAEMPVKDHYRKVVKDFFKDESSMPGTHRKIDTAQIVEEKTQRLPQSPQAKN